MSERAMPHLDGVRHRYLRVREVRMHIAEAGDPTAEAVVLVHGWPQHWYAWRRVIGPLAERYRVICPDLRGFGWSDAPRGSYRKSQLAADLIALLDVLGLERVRLAGHDWGGFAGFLACIEAPTRISHYLAAGITHPWIEADPPFRDRLELAVRLSYQGLIAAPLLGRQLVQRVPAFSRTMLRMGAASEAWDDDELDHFVSQWSEPDRAAAAVSLYRTFLTSELPALLADTYAQATVEIPMLLLLGETDPVIRPKLIGGGERNAPNLRREVLDGVGHWIPEEAPEQLVERMLALYAS